MINIIKYCFIIIFFSTACNTNTGLTKNHKLIYVDSLSNGFLTLKSHIVSLKDIKMPRSIGIIDSFLIVTDTYTSPFFHFYTLSNLKHIANFGLKGDSDFQLKSPQYNNQFYKERNHTFFYLTDLKKNLFLKFNLEKVLQSQNARPEITYRLPPSLILNYSSLYFLDNNIYGNFIGNNYNQKSGRFFIYNVNSKKLKWIKYFPNVPTKLPSYIIPYYYYSQSSFNVQKGILASAMTLFKRVDFLSVKSNKIYSTIFRGYANYVPFYDGINLPPTYGSKTFYISSYAGNSFFYALCVNNDFRNYLSNKGNMELHVFFWNGCLNKIIYLDRYYLGWFVVDEKNKKLYVINYGEDKLKSPILYYDLDSCKILR